MSNNTLHKTSWGRIYMMLRADIITNKMTLIALFGGLLLLIFCAPRIPLLFGVSYEEWAVDHSSLYTPLFVNFILTIAAQVYFYIYLNKKVVHSSPMTFATLPSQPWEKVVNILLYGLILQALAYATGLTEYALEVLSNPHIKPLKTADIQGSIILLLQNLTSYSHSELQVLTYIMTAAAIVGYFFLTFYVVLRMRNGFVALFVASVVSGLITTIFGFVVYLIYVALSADGLYIENGVVVNPNVYPAQLITTILAVGLSLVISYLSIRKLKTINS